MELSANELRLGNFLRDAKGRLCRVERLTIQDGILIDAPALSGAITSLPIAPIPLTEEWLIKAGFKKDEKGMLFIQVGNALYLEYDLELKEFTIPPETWRGSAVHFWNNPEYVHQLQNLYYALCGEELEFSNSPQ